MGNCKIESQHTIIKGIDADKWKVLLSFFKKVQVKCNEIDHAELSEKSDFFQEITAPKKVSLLKK